jgi:hypothetical protein
VSPLSFHYLRRSKHRPSNPADSSRP